MFLTALHFNDVFYIYIYFFFACMFTVVAICVNPATGMLFFAAPHTTAL